MKGPFITKPLELSHYKGWVPNCFYHFVNRLLSQVPHKSLCINPLKIFLLPAQKTLTTIVSLLTVIKELMMNEARIDTKYLLKNSVVVSWNDGMNLYFDPNDMAKAPVVAGFGPTPTKSVLFERIVASRIDLALVIAEVL